MSRGTPLRVRVYVDAFNLYYGCRAHASREQASTSWKWLDVRALAARVVERRWQHPATIEHVTYCTARISGPADAQHRQDAYLEALRRSGAVDEIEEGRFVERYDEYPRARRDRHGRPLVVRDGDGRLIMVGVSRREEKGSDVNVATRLVADALTGKMEAAVVVSNDSDLALPVALVRTLMPLGTINAHPNEPKVAHALRPQAGAGTGHWYDQLAFCDVVACQLPDPCAGVPRPRSW